MIYFNTKIACSAILYPITSKYIPAPDAGKNPNVFQGKSGRGLLGKISLGRGGIPSPDPFLPPRPRSEAGEFFGDNQTNFASLSSSNIAGTCPCCSAARLRY